MNPPEKYIFNFKKMPEILIAVPRSTLSVAVSWRIENEVPRPEPMIVAVYLYLGQTDKGCIYEYAGLEIK